MEAMTSTTSESVCRHPKSSIRYFSNAANMKSRALSLCLKCGLWQSVWKDGGKLRSETLGGRLQNREEFVVPARVIMAMVYEGPTD